MAMPVINTKTFNFDSQVSPDSTQYVGPTHTSTSKDLLAVKRTAPKVTKTSQGVERSSHKRTKSEVVNGQVVVGIVETTYSFPVGFSSAGKTELRTDNAAFATSTAGQALVDKATINF